MIFLLHHIIRQECIVMAIKQHYKLGGTLLKKKNLCFGFDFWGREEVGGTAFF